MDDKSISNDFVNSVLSKAHRAIAEFSLQTDNELTLREALGDTRSLMVQVVHKMSLYTAFWELLSNDYTMLKASLNTATTKVSPKGKGRA